MKASARLKASTTTPPNPVFVQRSPFVSANRIEVPLVEGSYLSEYVAIASMGLPAPLRPHVEVMLGEQVIDQRYWHRIKPKAGVTINIRVRPAGKGGKVILRMVIMIAVVVIASQILGPEAATLIGVTSHVGVALVTAAVVAITSFAAQLALNALIPPPKLSGGSDDSRPVLTGTNNKFEPYGPIPRIFGKTRCYPRIVGHPYTEINGHDQYLRMLLCAGYGPIKISDIKIGETPILDFAGSSVEVTEGGPAGWAGNKTLTLYSRQVRETQLSIELDDAGTTISQTTLPNTSEISVDVAFPAGLVTYTKKGEKDVRVVDLYVQYSPAGLGDWQPANFLNSDFDTGIKGGGHIQARANSQEVVRLTGRWTVPAGQYDVRIVRNTAAGQQVPGGKNEVDKCQWTALRSVTNDAPVNQTGVTLIAVRLKATDQLNGIPQEINCIAEAYIPVRDRATGTWSYQLTSNPAWAYADVFRRRGPDTIIADTRLDLDEIQDWADECAATAANAAEPMWRFDGQMESGSILTAAKQIAACGRASFTVREGKFSVVRDKAQPTPVQHFTPRNSWGYSGTRTFPDQPHALRCRFSNAAKNYVDDEVIVYADGYSAANATKYDTLEFYGMTSATQVFREGRYHLAVGKLRPEEHSISCDIEALRCTLGSRVQLSHDVILVGQTWGRITGVSTVPGSGINGYTVDEQVIFEEGKTYSLRIRHQDGSSSIRRVVPPGGATSGTYTNPAAYVYDTTNVQEGDLFMFGETGLESAPMVVKKIESGDNLSAVLTLVPYDEAIFTSDVDTIPAFSSYITQPVDVRQIAPPAPIVKLRSDDSVIDVLSDGTTVYRLAVDLAPSASAPAVIDHWEVEYRETGSDFWQSVPPAAASVKTVFIQPVRMAATYDVRARSVGSNGRPSSWVEVDSYVIVGKTIGPELPTAPALDPGYHSVAITWTNPQDLDLAAVEVLRNTVNNSATAVQIGASLTGLHVDQDLAIQPFYYWLRARDTSGNPSALVACGSTTPLNVIQYEQIGADGVLHPAEKLTVVREWAELNTEHTRLNAQADAYAIGAERDAFDTAVNALVTYLGGLTTPVNWDSTAGTTTIPDRGVWNSKWQAAYDARSALLNKIDDITAQISNAVSFTQYGTAPGSTFSIIGNRVAKKRGSSTDWDALQITRESFVGAARLRFQPGSSSAYGSAGLIETLPSPSATFSGTNSTEAWRQLPFALYFPGDGSVAVYEGAVYIGALLPAGSVSASDAYEIVYRNGTITYLRNGVVLRSITTAVGRRFYGAVTIAAALSAFTGFQLTEAPVQSTSLANAGGMKVEGQAVEKVSGTDGAWDASAISLDAFTGGCTLSFTADCATTKYFMLGLNGQSDLSDLSYGSLDFAIYLRGDGNVLAYESNVSTASLTTWTTGDRFMVRYNGTTITYYKNGVAFRTVSTTAGQTFYFDSTFYSIGARAKDILFVAGGSDGAPGSPGSPGANAKLLTLNATGDTMRFDGTGTIVAGQTIRFDIIGQNLAGTTCVVRAYRKNADGSETQLDAGVVVNSSGNGLLADTPDANSYTQTRDYVQLFGANFAAALGSGIGLIVEVSADGFTARRTIGITKDGATGSAGGYPAQSVGGAVPSSGTYTYPSSITLGPGQSISVTGEVKTASTASSGGTVSAQIQYSPSGSGSWSVAGSASGSDSWFNDGTPANVILSGSFTNTGTDTQVFDLRLSVSKTGGAVNFDQSRTYFKAG